MIKNKTQLSGKEASLFKTILQFYEHKQFKKGLKTADTILKKFPKHGETLAMKGLFLSNLNRSKEAHALIREGLKEDLTSHICWHVYGLLHRGEKNYEQALICYTRALKFDQDNVHITRDHSLLHMQMRNYDEYLKTRFDMFRWKPNQRVNWIGLAVAYELSGRLKEAVEIITILEDTLVDLPVNYKNYEHSELLLYKNSIIEKQGDFQEALRHLDQIKRNCLDMLAWREAKARQLVGLGRLEEASIIYKELFELNPDSQRYLDGIERCRGLNRGLENENTKKIVSFYSNMKEMYPKSHIVQRIPLLYATVENFKTLLDEHLRPAILKGIPSLFVTLKELYKKEWRVPIIEKLVLEYFTNLKNKNSFFNEPPSECETTPSPTAILWTAYFIAQHYDHLRNSQKALEWILVAEEHTPTLVEVYMTKARIYKHAGDLDLAAETMDKARQLDLQDRFVNTKCAKYMLRNNDEAKAKSTVGLFTKADIDPIDDLREMQCIWFFSETATSQLHQSKFGPSLKTCLKIDKFFIDFFDDQFDFHNYCLRKVTLRDYIYSLKVGDGYKGGHPKYIQNALQALATIKSFLDGQEEGDVAMTLAGVDRLRVSVNNIDGGGLNSRMEKLSLADQKKNARKQRKLLGKKEGVTTTLASVSSGADDVVVDDDLDGEKIFGDEKRLVEEGIRFVQALQEGGAGDVEIRVWSFGVNLYTRQGKFLIAWKSFKKGYLLNPEDPDLLRELILFLFAFYKESPTLSPEITTLLTTQFTNHKIFKNILPINQTTPQTLLKTLKETYKSSLHHVLKFALISLLQQNQKETTTEITQFFKMVKIAKPLLPYCQKKDDGLVDVATGLLTLTLETAVWAYRMVRAVKVGGGGGVVVEVEGVVRELFEGAFGLAVEFRQ